jgi:hypothetical protein
MRLRYGYSVEVYGVSRFRGPSGRSSKPKSPKIGVSISPVKADSAFPLVLILV